MHPLYQVAPGVHPDAAPIGADDWTPTKLAAAYGITYSPTNGAGYTIALVDAFDAPHIQRDLNKFSKKMGLPKCTAANGCFRKVNQRGEKTPLPPTNAGWAGEIAIDVEWAHAMAPAATIVLVEADDNFIDSLGAAEDYANSLPGAVFVSNSYGGGEFQGEQDFDHFYAPKPNHSILVSSGDHGLPAEYPSSSPQVISVGGTTLKVSGATVTETVWAHKANSPYAAGGGCSAFEAPTSAQVGVAQVLCRVGGLTTRATPDLSAVADPATGVLVFTSDAYATPRWVKFGGTSVASPVMAGIGATRGLVFSAQMLYQSGALKFRDANATADGSTNGAKCRIGIDLCTGRGALIK